MNQRRFSVLTCLAAFGCIGWLLGALTGHREPRPHPGLRPATAHAAVSVIPPPTPTEDPRVTLGRGLFFDESLSEPAGTSCASCHDPARGYAGNHGSSHGTALGSRPERQARRSTPSVLYLRFVRRFHLVWDDDADLPEASGGFFWDGRADTIAALVRQPLVNADEMGNRDLHQVAQKIARGEHAEGLRRNFDDAFASDEATVSAVSLSIEAFLTSRAMSPFSSRYDDFVRGQAQLSSLELRGLAVFEDIDKGACSTCHRLDYRSGVPEASLFSDFGYEVVGVPRNRRLLPDRGARRHDLGVCERSHPRLHTEDPWFCGAFRTPSLRNVALRPSFMHNGVFSSLREVLDFYATRSTDPARWYGETTFDDLPARHRDNVNTDLPPYNQPRGESPRLQPDDIDAILAFLDTLTDQHIPPPP
ncbi:MAG: cytochrome c peroxidase [Polyangiales bacterium]